ncbi:hypothetical protein ABEB36_001341 [Hypothenemus hampei]|uniref:RRM domain-containing protein n=1 Tax=Hypothenemus hampei TaxID=57062 RepID=A0ABD1FEB1_HYPHA
MSRLIVKNLPKIITEEKLRELFNPNGTITDIQLKYTKQGTFRRFGFIGFQNEEEADRAVQALNNTFINTSKISVDKCALLGDAHKPKAWSKYAADSSAYKKLHTPTEQVENTGKDIKVKKKTKKENEVENILEKYKDDPLFEDFLQVQGDSNKLEKLKELKLKKSSKNDSTSDSGHESPEESEEKVANKAISDLEYMEMLKPGSEKKPRQKMEKKPKEKMQLYNLKLRNLPYKIKKKDIKDFFRQNMPFSIRIPRQDSGIVFVGYKTEKGFKKALTKDKSFIKGKQVRVLPFNEHNKSEKQAETNKVSKWKNQEEALKNEEGIAESGRIFVRNLSYTATEKDLEDLFSKYGNLTELNMPIDIQSKQPKGFATITFMFPEHAVQAYTELDGTILQGRMMHLLPGKAKDKPESEETSNFKQKKIEKQKSQAGSSHNWNTLFLGHDAVAQVIADTHDVSKEAVVGPDAKGSAAVRLALGETQIVMQTRKYLEEHGVVIDVFNHAPKTRSKTVILVKNLPSKTEAKEIKEIFEKHGDLGRVILPPSGISAIVEFLEPSEARKAFLKVAYSKFKNVPLYLEWAPENALTEEKVKNNESLPVEESPQPEKSEEPEPEPEPDTTLFVKNLNFQTSDQLLKAHFEGCGRLKSATVAMKKDPNNPGAKLSMGYGFVQFYLKKSADEALKTLQQSVLDGKSLELKRSERAFKNEVKNTRKSVKLINQNGSKILIRNVPFQANKKDIFELFGSFGEIKALRLPRKMTPGADSHRGFAFVDYGSPTDAKAAFEALSQSTHLFGRRLVLEWATTEEAVEDIRKRTAEHFSKKEEVKSKKSVFNID